MAVFLQINGFKLTLNQKEFYELGIEITTSQIELSKIVQILRKNTSQY